MTRSLRKRHLIMWVVIAVSVAILAFSSRVSIPSFVGDRPKLETTK